MSAVGIIICIFVALFCGYIFWVIRSIEGRNTNDRIKEMNGILDSRLREIDKTLKGIKKIIGNINKK